MKKKRPADLSQIREYNQALDAECEAYFYMRGVEGYIQGRMSHPYYHGERWAQELWETGHRAAIAYEEAHGEELDARAAPFCDAFMFGAEGPHPCKSSIYGVIFRLKFERLKGRHFDQPQNPHQGDLLMSESVKQLYAVAGTKKMGERVGEDSEGNVVLKIGGEYEAFPSDKVEKVMPHTICISSCGAERHYKVAKDKFRKGDIIIMKTSKGLLLSEITELDSQCESAGDFPEGNFKGFAVKQSRAKAKAAKK